MSVLWQNMDEHIGVFSLCQSSIASQCQGLWGPCVLFQISAVLVTPSFLIPLL